jgi:acetylcholinesterase
LGFPLGNEAYDAGALNLGLKDQKLALQWIQDSIDAFGGDKSKVTAFGESAGAISLATLMLDPSFENLARGVILQSGSAASISNTFNATTPGKNLDWANFVSAVPECASKANTTETFDCLRGVKNDTVLIQAWANTSGISVSGIPWVPTLDGDVEESVFRDLPSRIFKEGKMAKIPFITGTNLDEGQYILSSKTNLCESYLFHQEPSLLRSPKTTPPRKFEHL